MFRILLSSFFLVLLYPTAIDLYLVGLPQIAAELKASESQLHMAFSIYLAGMAATMLFAGKISDAIGRKPIAIIGSAIFIAASFFAGMAQDADIFLAARFAQGIGAGACYVVAFAILRDSLEDQLRAKILTMLNGITCIVPVIAPVIGHLIMLKFPWQTLFTTMAWMGIAVCLLSALIFKETRSETPKDHQSTSPASQESLFERFFISRLVIAALGVTTILTYVNVSPMLLMGELGLDRAGYSSVMAGTALISMLTSFSVPFALNHFKQQTLMISSQVLLFVSAVLLATITLEPLITILSYGLICAGFSIGFGVTMSQALSQFSQKAGVASALLGIAQVCCSAIYIWFMGIVGVNALNMLVFALAIGSAFSLALILLNSKLTDENHYEEISSPS